MKSIHDIRRDNLRRLIDERFGSSQTQFAKAVGLRQPSFVSRLLTDREPTRKNIGTQLARDFENALGLAPNVLDSSREATGVARETALHVRESLADKFHVLRSENHPAIPFRDAQTPVLIAGSERTERRVALLNADQLGQFDAISEVYEVIQPAEMITIQADVNVSSALALRLPDDSMGERFPKGSIVVIADVRAPRPDDFVVGVPPGSTTAGMRQWAAVADRHFLVPLNRAHPAIEVTPECRVLGVVVEAVLFFPSPPGSPG